MENLCPFYPQDIYNKLNECLAAARGEILDVKTGGEKTFTTEWLLKGQDRMDKFSSAHFSVTEAIRTRISALAVIPR
jgi:hypothetical protein